MTIIISTSYMNHAQITRGAEFLSWICHIQTISVRWICTSLAGLASITHAKPPKMKKHKICQHIMATKVDQILQVWVSLSDNLFKDMTMLCQISPHALSPGTSSLIGKHSTQTLSAQKVLSLDSSSRNRMNSTHQFVSKVQNNKGKG